MALQVATGVFELNGAASSTKTVTTTGVTPRVILMWTANRTEATDSEGSAHMRFGYGWAAWNGGSIQNQVIGFSSEDGATPLNTVGAVTVWSNAHGIAVPSAAAGSFSFRAVVDQMNAGSFRLTLSDAWAGERVHYIALGGDVSNAKIIYKDCGLSDDAALAITGAGFQPEAAFFMTNSTNLNTQSGKANCTPGLGFFVGSSGVGGGIGMLGDHNLDGERWSGSRSTDVFAPSSVSDPNTGQVRQSLQFSSWDSDGVVVDYDTLGGKAHVAVLCIEGGGWHADEFTTYNDTSNHPLTGAGFAPAAALYFSTGAAEIAATRTGDLLNTDQKVIIGATDGTTSHCAASSAQHVADPSEAYTAIEYDEVYINPDLADGHGGEMDIVSLDADGLTNKMGVAETPGSHVIVVMVGDTIVTTPLFLPEQLGSGQALGFQQ